MGTFKTFEEIEAWVKARMLVRRIYTLTSRGKLAKDFPLSDQMRRAAISIMSNIAEGFERSGTKEFIQFLSLAKGSAGEVRSHLYVARDAEYLDEGEFTELVQLVSETSRMISGLMAYLKKTDLKGSKFNRREL